jgi:hypothetical protein
MASRIFWRNAKRIRSAANQRQALRSDGSPALEVVAQVLRFGTDAGEVGFVALHLYSAKGVGLRKGQPPGRGARAIVPGRAADHDVIHARDGARNGREHARTTLIDTRRAHVRATDADAAIVRVRASHIPDIAMRVSLQQDRIAPAVN